MKLVIAAASLFLLGAFASAQESAYSSLVGMAESAAADRGPDSGEVPVSAPRRAPARPATAELVVAPLARRVPSVWTRLYSSLTPARKAPSVSSYRVELSTGALAARSSLEVEASSAAPAGELRGMAEYLAVSAAPAPLLPLRGR